MGEMEQKSLEEMERTLSVGDAPSKDAERRFQFHGNAASPSSTDDLRLFELEIENLRLQRLVTELLLKNQQLRDRH